LFTENETNAARLFGGENASPFVKDAFHEVVIHGRAEAANPAEVGTKAAAWYRLSVPARGRRDILLRLTAAEEADATPFGASFESVFEARGAETDQFYAEVIPQALDPESRNVARQAYAGLLWSKQFYHYVVKDWLEGDPAQPTSPESRRAGRNCE